MLLLLMFTLCEAYMVSFITSYFAEYRGGAIVIVAACMTLGIRFFIISHCCRIDPLCHVHQERLLNWIRYYVWNHCPLHHVRHLRLDLLDSCPPQPLLRPRSLSLRNLPRHRHPTHRRRWKILPLNGWLRRWSHDPVHRHHPDLLVHPRTARQLISLLNNLISVHIYFIIYGIYWLNKNKYKIIILNLWSILKLCVELVLPFRLFKFIWLGKSIHTVVIVAGYCHVLFFFISSE